MRVGCYFTKSLSSLGKVPRGSLVGMGLSIPTYRNNTWLDVDL